MNQPLTVKSKWNPSAENNPGWRVQTSSGSEMGSSALCVRDDMNVFQPILLFDNFILPLDIIFPDFRQSINDVWYKSIHTKC